MKVLILQLVMLALLTNSSYSQYIGDNHLEDYSSYKYQKDDPINPVLVGVCNYFVPGIGHMICGENSRGLVFFGSSVVSTIVMTLGYVILPDSPDINPQRSTFGLITALVGGVSYLVVDVWSIIDGVKIAKISNLRDRSRIEGSSSITAYPYIDRMSMGKQRSFGVVGLRFGISF